jgi:hypothetical protein
MGHGFSLVFLFADQPAAVSALRQLYGDSLHLRALRLRELKPSNSAQLAGLAEEMLKTRVGYGPLWVELWQGGEEADWDRQRISFLHRLNENRSALERNVRQPVVIIAGGRTPCRLRPCAGFVVGAVIHQAVAHACAFPP